MAWRISTVLITLSKVHPDVCKAHSLSSYDTYKLLKITRSSRVLKTLLDNRSKQTNHSETSKSFCSKITTSRYLINFLASTIDWNGVDMGWVIELFAWCTGSEISHLNGYETKYHPFDLGQWSCIVVHLNAWKIASKRLYDHWNSIKVDCCHFEKLFAIGR